jgi:hypothetical protein
LSLLDADSLTAADAFAMSAAQDGFPGSLDVECVHGVRGIVAARRGLKAMAELELAWLSGQAKRLEFGNSTMWRARIVYAMKDRTNALALARSAIGQGYPRWFMAPGDEAIVPVHQILEFTALAREGLR